MSPEDDYDGDGSPNGEEFCVNTDPADDESFFAVISILKNLLGCVDVTWKCAAGTTYRVEYCDEVMAPGMTWLTAEDGITTSMDGEYTWMDTGSCTGTPPLTVPCRNYRVMVYSPCSE